MIHKKWTVKHNDRKALYSYHVLEYDNVIKYIITLHFWRKRK